MNKRKEGKKQRDLSVTRTTRHKISEIDNRIRKEKFTSLQLRDEINCLHRQVVAGMLNSDDPMAQLEKLKIIEEARDKHTERVIKKKKPARYRKVKSRTDSGIIHKEIEFSSFEVMQEKGDQGNSGEEIRRIQREKPKRKKKRNLDKEMFPFKPRINSNYKWVKGRNNISMERYGIFSEDIDE